VLYPLSYGGPARTRAVDDSSASIAGLRIRTDRVCDVRRWAVATAVLLLSAACVARPAPGPAVIRSEQPPWPAPRDGVAYFEAAGVEASRLDDTTNQRAFRLRLSIDGIAVPVAAHIGTDRVRALQAPAHTHDDSGTVWVEGRGSEMVTLGQFFTLWGVRFDDRCLGGACGALAVRADGRGVGDPSGLVLATVAESVEVEVRSGG
jgi:hypothetical protein